MTTVERSRDRTMVDAVLRSAGIDLWGAAANDPVMPAAPGLPVAISLMARVDPHALARLQLGEPAAYRAEYRRLNSLLDAAGDALRRTGATAQRRDATVYAERPETGDWLAAGVFVHKTAATRAGLGWIGKTALFVSPETGPKVRLATVFTDLPLDTGTPVTEGRCGSCRACLDACPAQAGRDVVWQAGMSRDELFDAAACDRHMASLAPVDGHRTCGLCVAACPFGRV
jgi:epoxyqueuosine reductase QueG